MKPTEPELMPREMPLKPETQLAKFESGAVEKRAPVSALSILDAAVRGGINKDNVEVVERLVALRREELKEQSKIAFAKAFFQLRKSMPDLYADKSAKDKAGHVVYTYCSEEEISKMLEPHLFRHGFAMLFGQSSADGRITVNVTLMHEEGHSELREFTVRSGTPNSMKDGAMCDAGGATTAWRHLMIKMFGLKSRITREDARLEGANITAEQADELEKRVALLGDRVNREAFFKFAGAKSFSEIPSGKYDVIDQFLKRKEQGQ